MTTPTNTLDKGKVQLGIIGLGLMGSRLTQRLHSAGWTFLSSLNERTVSCQFTTCWNRSRHQHPGSSDPASWDTKQHFGKTESWIKRSSATLTWN
ncbi:MAG: hypothetical protein QOJ42_5512 [Acidobacteriaceae bacterium]|jgi:hypothetical protein|nr:hypothetical protein [Acidobacteriaceae bacterium]